MCPVSSDRGWPDRKSTPRIQGGGGQAPGSQVSIEKFKLEKAAGEREWAELEPRPPRQRVGSGGRGQLGEESDIRVHVLAPGGHTPRLSSSCQMDAWQSVAGGSVVDFPVHHEHGGELHAAHAAGFFGRGQGQRRLRPQRGQELVPVLACAGSGAPDEGRLS